MLRYAAPLGPDAAALDQDRTSSGVERIRRDMDSALAAGQVSGTATLFFGGVVHRGGYDPALTCCPIASIPARCGRQRAPKS